VDFCRQRVESKSESDHDPEQIWSKPISISYSASGPVSVSYAISDDSNCFPHAGGASPHASDAMDCRYIGTSSNVR